MDGGFAQRVVPRRDSGAGDSEDGSLAQQHSPPQLQAHFLLKTGSDLGL